MQTSIGSVLSVAGDRAAIEIDPEVICERCAAGKGCGAGLFGQRRGKRRIEVDIAPGVYIHAGDTVELSLLPARLLRAAGIVYGLPLGCAIFASGASWLAGLGEWQASLAALLGMAIGYVVAKSRLRRDRCLREFTPLVTAHIAAVR